MPDFVSRTSMTLRIVGNDQRLADPEPLAAMLREADRSIDNGHEWNRLGAEMVSEQRFRTMY
jgi:hypothetical protein